MTIATDQRQQQQHRRAATMPQPGKIDHDLAVLQPKLISYAKKIECKSAGIDYEDLVQVALISAWMTLAQGIEPSMDVLIKRMHSEVRRDDRAAQGDMRRDRDMNIHNVHGQEARELFDA